MQISRCSNPAIIVIGVTPGYALKVIQRVPNQGKFLNPGSAGMLHVLKLSIKCALNFSPFKNHF